MTLVERIAEESRLLPVQAQREVLDFVQFLLHKKQKQSSPPESLSRLAEDSLATARDSAEDDVWNDVPAVWTDAEFKDMSLHQALRGMEDESPLYCLDDLKERWR